MIWGDRDIKMEQKDIFTLLCFKSELRWVRASTATVVYVLNAKYLAHLAQKTPKTMHYQMC